MVGFIGGMTCRELRQRIDEAEFQRWIRYYNVEPFGFPRQEARHGAMVSSVYSASNLSFGEPFINPNHWLYSGGSSHKHQTDEELIHSMHAMRKASGG